MILFQIENARVGIEDARHLVFEDTNGVLPCVRFGQEGVYLCRIQV